MSLIRRGILAISQNQWMRAHAPRFGFMRRASARFLPGEDVQDAISAARALAASGIHSVLSHLGENIADRDEAAAVTRHFLELNDRIRAAAIPALKHPTWVMGKRITIDSATMMNKGFEIIEACRLFNLPPEKVRVTIHPQSTVHSMVEFVDGSILAQISVTDMCLPILYALAYPERPAAPQLSFDLATLSQLDFAPPDPARFPCLRLAYEAAEAGPAACIALNAADEIAVAAFLEGRIPFPGIPHTIEEVLAATPSHAPASIEDVLVADEGQGICRKLILRHSAHAIRV